MRITRRKAVGTVVGLALAVTASTAVAASLEPDGVHLKAPFANGGEAWLELEDRNVEPAVCFIYDNDVPQDGDSFSSRILTRAGAEVVDLGTADQWVDGAGEGCEIPRDERYRDVFANPSAYVVELTVEEEQGTPPTPPLRSQPLQHDSGE